MSNTLSKTLGLGLPALAEMIRAKGRGKDTILAHITPREAALLKKRGGRGSTNPDTGLLEYGEDDEDPFGSNIQLPPGGNYEPDVNYSPYIPNNIDYMDNRDVRDVNQIENQPLGPYYPPASTQFISDDQQTALQENQREVPQGFGEDLPIFDPNTGAPMTGAQVAAANPRLYPGGVLPADNQETVYTPEGNAYYRTATPIPTASGTPTKPPGGKDIDLSSLLSQLLKLGLPFGIAAALTKGVAQPAAKKAEDQAQTAKNERMAIATPYQNIGKGLINSAQAGNLSASNIQAVKAARAMAAQNISRTGGVGVLQGANSIADLEARLLDNQLIQGIKIANIGDNYAVNAIQAGMAADKDLAASQADFAKQLGVLLAPSVLGYSPSAYDPTRLDSSTRPSTRQSTGALNNIVDTVLPPKEEA